MSGNMDAYADPDRRGTRIVDDPKADPLRSPLHRLQTEIAKDTKYSLEHSISGGSNRVRDLQQNLDNESIYLFDSVSTSGRLLDRLDLDPDDYNDDSWLRRRESTFLVQSTGRLLDRLGLEDSTVETAQPMGMQHTNSLSSNLTLDTRFVPIRANSSLGMERLRSASKVPIRTDSASGKLPVMTAPGGVVRQPANSSFDSLHGDIAITSPNSALSLTSLEGSSFGNPKRSSSHEIFKNGRPELNSHVNSTVSLPKAGALDAQAKQRSASGQSVSSTNSVTSFDCAQVVFNFASFFDAQVELNLKKAMALRAEGNHREASYQLQILANPPTNYPKAMYLYSQALQLGQGVKLNHLQSVRWLCRCILVCYMLEATPPSDDSVLTNYVFKLAEVLPDRLISIIDHNLSDERNDPFKLNSHFETLSPTTIKKIMLLNTKDNNVLGSAYFALAKNLLHGQGIEKDEERARLFFAKSASVGYSNAMVVLGELWSNKSKSFKKDLHLAAAWLRLGELFGETNMGNSWIFKEKYMERKKIDDDKKIPKDRKLF